VIPCINTRQDWVNVMSRWIDQWAKAETATSA
jgi:ferrochelatase